MGLSVCAYQELPKSICHKRLNSVTTKDEPRATTDRKRRVGAGESAKVFAKSAHQSREVGTWTGMSSEESNAELSKSLIMIRAGLPLATHFGGTLKVRNVFGRIVAPSPM